MQRLFRPVDRTDDGETRTIPGARLRRRVPLSIKRWQSTRASHYIAAMEPRCCGGVVAAGSELAAEAGADMFEWGGNVDAAVAGISDIDGCIALPQA